MLYLANKYMLKDLEKFCRNSSVELDFEGRGVQGVIPSISRLREG